MTKKEISEIKKLYTINQCSITRITGCYVDGEGNIRSTFKDAFLSLPEEVMHKYLAIFKKTLSGTPEKNLLTFEFPTDTEYEGGTQHSLLKLRDSKLKDDNILQSFYKRIIDTYQYVGNYLILLIHNAYDIPGKGTDSITQEDASDEVYEYISCIICPVELSKPGLSYDQNEDNFKNRDRDWVVGAPEVSFMFPAFTDRSTDIHNVLYYEKKAAIKHEEIISDILGCNHTLTADEQKESFTALLEKCNCSTEQIIEIHEKLNEMIEEKKEQTDETLVLEKRDVEKLLQTCVSEDTMCEFSAVFNECVGRDTELVAQNITDTKKMEIKNPNVSIKVAPDKADLVKEMILDGVKCIVIEIGSEVEINGTRVSNK